MPGSAHYPSDVGVSGYQPKLQINRSPSGGRARRATLGYRSGECRPNGVGCAFAEVPRRKKGAASSPSGAAGRSLYAARSSNTHAGYIAQTAGNQSEATQDAGLQHLAPLLIVLVELFGYFLDDNAEFADDTADNERFTIRHEVHALGHVHVVDEPFVGYFQRKTPGEIVAV